MYDMDTDYALWNFDAPKKPDTKPAKGTCSKCGEHIGRGVHFHERTCDGSRSDSAGGAAA